MLKSVTTTALYRTSTFAINLELQPLGLEYRDTACHHVLNHVDAKGAGSGKTETGTETRTGTAATRGEGEVEAILVVTSDDDHQVAPGAHLGGVSGNGEEMEVCVACCQQRIALLITP